MALIRTQISITKEQQEDLRKLAKNGRGIAEHIRNAIDLYLEMIRQREPNRLPKKE